MKERPDPTFSALHSTCKYKSAWHSKSAPSTQPLTIAVGHKEQTAGLTPELGARGRFSRLSSWSVVVSAALGVRSSAGRTTGAQHLPWMRSQLTPFPVLYQEQGAKLTDSGNRRRHSQPANTREEESKAASAGHAPLQAEPSLHCRFRSHLLAALNAPPGTLPLALSEI